MTRPPDSPRVHDLKTFAAGAACGILAGAFLVALIVWQFGNVIGSRTASLERPADAPDAVARWTAGSDGPDDGGAGVLDQAEERPAGTAGSAPRDPASVPAGATIGPAPTSPAELEDRDLLIPVEGVGRDALTRQFADLRGSRRHEALDILAPRNTAVRAVEDGSIARLFNSKAGGITVYQFDPTARFCYYYAHLERYADGLKEGASVRKGQILGYVGTSGNAPQNAPHLHFAIFRLTDEKRWWEGTPIDPYDVLR